MWGWSGTCPIVCIEPVSSGGPKPAEPIVAFAIETLEAFRIQRHSRDAIDWTKAGTVPFAPGCDTIRMIHHRWQPTWPPAIAINSPLIEAPAELLPKLFDGVFAKVYTAASKSETAT